MKPHLGSAIGFRIPRGLRGLLRLGLVPLLLLAALGPALFSKNASAMGAFDGKPEYEARAAFLLLFAKYTKWPESSLTSGSAEFIIGVFGEDPFGTALSVQAGAMIHGRKLVIRHFRSPAKIAPCQILYFPASEERQLPALREKLAAWNVLTVGETPRFLEAGGILSLFTEGERLRFEVDLGAMNQARVRVEAKVLRFAKQVH